MQKKAWISENTQLQGYCRVKCNASLAAPPLLTQIPKGPAKTLFQFLQWLGSTRNSYYHTFFPLFKHQHRPFIQADLPLLFPCSSIKGFTGSSCSTLSQHSRSSHTTFLHFLVPANLLNHWFPFPFILLEPKEAKTNAISVGDFTTNSPALPLRPNASNLFGRGIKLSASLFPQDFFLLLVTA